MSRLLDQYKKEIIPALKGEFDYKNPMQVPKLEKVVVSIGVGSAVSDSKRLEIASESLAKITGQKGIVTKAKNSIAGFKLREGMPIGVKVTLRGEMMYEFVDRLVAIVLPRVRDFRGIDPNGFDKHGNYNLGLREHSVFPEISFEDLSLTHGVQITIVTTAKTDDEGIKLLELMGFPFKGIKVREGAHNG